MDILVDLFIGFGVAAAVYFWVKTQLFKPEITHDIEVVPSRGVPLVKRNQANAPANEQASAEKIVESDPIAEAGIETHQSAPINPQPIVLEQDKTSVDQVPADSVLKRHYLSSLQAERQAITHPYPTDSILRRHYEAARFSVLEQSKTSQKPTTAIQLEKLAVADKDIQVAANICIPEDSVLKRHFMAQLQCAVEQHYGLRPEEATLKRHYAQMVQSKIAALLV